MYYKIFKVRSFLPKSLYNTTYQVRNSSIDSNRIINPPHKEPLYSTTGPQRQPGDAFPTIIC